jgi:tetratricopeptide (TPR) repeat protein
MSSTTKHLIRASFVIAILWCSYPVFGQQITGQVIYSDTGQAAFNVPVHCIGTAANTQTQTDRSGRFVCNVAAGHYDVTVDAPGYGRQTLSVDILDSNATEFTTFRLRPDVSPAAAEFQKAQALFATGKKEDTEEGIRHLEKALSMSPKNTEAQLRLSTAYMDLRQWDKAELALKKTIELDPKAANAYFALGEVYLRQKKDDQAEKVLRDGLAIESHSAQAHLALARVYWDKFGTVKEEAQWRPPLEKAYQEVKQALELDPNLAAAHLLKGDLYFKVRRAEDALKEFDEYLRLDPNGEFAPQTRELAEKIRKALAQTKKP